MATNSQNWPFWWRAIILANICIYTTMGNWFTACISPLLFIISEDLQVDIGTATKTITYVVMAIGLSVSASAIAINFDYNSFLAARILGGFGAGIVEALRPLIVAETFPERSLASAMVIYVLSLGAGASVGPFIAGLLIGIPLGGIAADVLSRRSARRKDGFHVRESRLPAVLPGAVMGPIDVLVIGICLQNNLSWAGMAIGWAMLNVALTASANVMLTYAVDCYPWRAAHIGVVVNVLKNLVAFGVGYGVTPWLEAVGPEEQFGTMAGILWFFFLFIIPLGIFGPKLRLWSLKWIL